MANNSSKSNQVYITRRLPESAVEMLKREGFDVTLHKGQEPPTRKEIMKNVEGKDAVLCMISDRMDKEVMDAAGPQLKIISSYSTGFEHIDVAEATRRGIYVTYTSDILAEATADITFALLLACARNIVEGDRMVKQKKWKVGWMPDLLLGQNVHGSTVGIVGLGKIGAAVARRARGFGMEILYNNRRRLDEAAEKEAGAKYVDLDCLLKRSDFVTLHTTLNDASRHLINSQSLQKMKKTAFLINTARGAVINERDLATALKKGTIAGAGLDVFEKEPLGGKSPLLALRNVVLLPHIGSADLLTRSRMAQVAAKSILDVVVAGKEPGRQFLVNPQVRQRS
ncbi:MAG TPA: D-glycerate dehydrogenase [Nitrososphaera sp.]|nr:D-glycerate dehydrogenase [Nitrososphaera sp.]